MNFSGLGTPLNVLWEIELREFGEIFARGGVPCRFEIECNPPLIRNENQSPVDSKSNQDTGDYAPSRSWTPLRTQGATQDFASPRKIQTCKIFEVKLRCYVTSFSGVDFVVEAAEEYVFSIDADMRQPTFIVLVEADADKAGGSF